MSTPDPTDVRLLALVAEVGRVAVHDLAKRAGLDVREVAARLAALAANGFPLVVGVECDPAALRYALSTGRLPVPPVRPTGLPGTPGPVGPAAPLGPAGSPAPSGPAGSPVPSGLAGPAAPMSQPLPVAGQPGPRPPQFGPIGSGPQSAATSGPQQIGPQSTGGWQGGPRVPAAPAGSAADPVGTWGPPGSADWARRDDPPVVDPLDEPRTVRTTPSRGGAARRTGSVGDTLQTDGLAIQLIEVVDPADFLFTAAGYKLQPGERSVVVHTELTNRGSAPLASLPDLYLVLLDAEGQATSKAPVSLTSRPPHRVGVRPGETAGGHTVYVLPEGTALAAVRWRPRPDEDEHTLTWKIQDP